MNGCFVTGTDTEVGKTRISAGLLHWLSSQNLRCAGYKPVAAGTEIVNGEPVNEDVRTLRNASSVTLSDADVSPFCFDTPCAPHIAADLEGRAIDRAALLQGAHALAARTDRLIVEGVGGFCVPLGPDFDTADLAQDLALPVVLVVGLRLGCISHALLSAEAVRARGLRLAGWVANVVDPDMLRPLENLATLRHELQRRHQAPCLGMVPRLATPDPASVASQLDDAALRTLFGLDSPDIDGRIRPR